MLLKNNNRDHFGGAYGRCMLSERIVYSLGMSSGRNKDMNSYYRRNFNHQSDREEVFWDCCLELIPILYICIMTLGVCLLCRYGLYVQGNPGLGTEVHTPGRISKYYLAVAALYYGFLGLSLLFPIRRSWENLNGHDEYHIIDDWRFSGKKAIFLVISIVGALIINKTRFYVLWDEQIANQCRAVLIIGGAVMAVIGHLIIRIAIWRKTEPEQCLSYRASTVCEIITKCCIVLTIIGAILFIFIIPADAAI